MYYVPFLVLLTVLMPRTAVPAQEDAADPVQAEVAADAGVAKDEKDPNRGRFLPIPFVVTEPAIGEGLGAGLVYFHRIPQTARPKVTSGSNIARTGKRGKTPPTASGVFGMYTNTETFAFGIGHSGSSPTDKYRYVGALAGMSVNATYYEQDFPFNFNMEGKLMYLHGKRRWRQSNIFVGLSASYLDSETEFKVGNNSERQPSLLDFSAKDIGIAVSGIYDGRDDTMMPGSGQLFDLTIWKYDEGLGGDFDYWTSRFKFNTFHQLAEKFVLGFRLEVATADGDVPYYAEPYVSLRGIPALRYTGDTAGVIELEGRYDLSPRWSAIAFGGLGFVDETGLSATEDDIYGYGAGIRFKALPDQGVWIGIDIAQGPEEKAWYVQVGHPW